jgi:predicted metalloendopeptidase
MVNYLFDSFKKIIVVSIFSFLKKKAKLRIKVVFFSQQSDWMSYQTRLAALQKAESFTALVGYDDYIVDDSARLNKEHEEVTEIVVDFSTCPIPGFLRLS